MTDFHRCLFAVCFAAGLSFLAVSQAEQIGVARIDITPSHPVRLSGYAVRKKESEGVAHRLYAKAIALGNDANGPALLITVDNTGVPATVRDEVLRRLHKKAGIKQERFCVSSTHTHTGPCLAGYLPTLFGEPFPPEHQAHIDRYTRELIDSLESVALDALKNRAEASLAWGRTTALFAANRRTKGGPVDHDLPVLCIFDNQQKIRDRKR